MQYFTLDPIGDGLAKVTAMIHSPSKEVPAIVRPVMVVCPGGGYGFVSDREEEPVAERYYAAGYNTFILEYSVGELAKDFRPLCQLAGTVAYIRAHAEGWGSDPDKVAVCGFSAGAHLAASLGTLYDDAKFQSTCPEYANVRPDAMVLSYPVIVANEFAHTGSIHSVSGDPSVDGENYRYFGLEGHVDGNTPPAFLWHTADDDCVPVENSLQFAAALSKAKVPFELHIFPHGPHGMSVCGRGVNSKDDYNGRWVQWSIDWLNQLFDFQM